MQQIQKTCIYLENLAIIAAVAFINYIERKIIMRMPRKDTHVFKILCCLVENGEMTAQEVFDKIGKVNRRGLAGITRMLNDAIRYQFVTLIKDKYQIIDDVAAYIEDILEVTTVKKPTDSIVQPAYKNNFTPEMKTYDSKLFLNKRGYENDT